MINFIMASIYRFYRLQYKYERYYHSQAYAFQFAAVMLYDNHSLNTIFYTSLETGSLQRSKAFDNQARKKQPYTTQW